MKVFKEEQRFTQTWLIVLLAISTLIPLVIVFSEYSKGKKTLNELLTVVIIMVFATGFIFFFKLKTRIDEVGIHYQFFPFHFSLKTINWNNISKAHVRTYDPIGEYGGWGLKGGAFWNSSKGKAINVSGDIGIQLELKNGKKLLIGTNKDNEAKQVLITYNSKVTTL